MTMKDPRETLIEKGSALLDVIYLQHQWDVKYRELAEVIKQRPEDLPPEQVAEIVSSAEFLDALLSRLQLDTECAQLRSEYLMLRSTIEAFETPRPTMPTIYEEGEL